MKIKKVTAALLCAAMTVSFCSCNSNKKATTDIEAVIKEFESALQEADTDALLELTSWDDDDKDYKNIEELIDDAEYTIELAEHKEYIASTIKVNYEKEDIEINGKEASVKITYELVDWEAEYNSPSKDSDDLVDKLKDSDDTTKIKGKIEFELVDGEWKINKITKLSEVYDFCFAYAFVEPVETDITIDPTPIPTSTDVEIDPLDYDEILYRTIKHYLAVLSENEAAIRNIEDHYNTPYCGLADLNMDGFPELYFIAGTDKEIYAGDLYVYSYNPYADEAQNVYTITYAIYSAGDGGGVMIYYTNNEVLFAKSYGDDMYYFIETAVLDFNWNSIATYKRMYDYSPESTGTTYFENDVIVDEDYYMTIMKVYVYDTQCVPYRGIGISDNYVEAPLRYLATVDMVTYDELYSILDSMI